MPRTRMASSRGAGTRQQQARQAPTPTLTGILYIPPHIIPRDKEYAWARFATRNQPDEGNILRKQMEGWTPVPYDRHPELATPFWIPGRENAVNTVVIRVGLVLMERDKRMGMEARQRKRQTNLDELRAVRWTLGDDLQDDPRMPFFQANNDVGFEQVHSIRRAPQAEE